MKQGDSEALNLTQLLRFPRPLSPSWRPFGRLQTHSCLRALQESAPRHPQIGERKQRMQLRCVLGQSPIANLYVPELALDDPERMFHLGADAGLDVLKLV